MCGVILRREGCNMSKDLSKNKNKTAIIIKLNAINRNIIASPSVDISFSEMVMNNLKRKCVYAKYDSKYKSTMEEDEIFNKMTARRKRGK